MRQMGDGVDFDANATLLRINKTAGANPIVLTMDFDLLSILTHKSRRLTVWRP